MIIIIQDVHHVSPLRKVPRMKLAAKKALITGGSSGIGLAMRQVDRNFESQFTDLECRSTEHVAPTSGRRLLWLLKPQERRSRCPIIEGRFDYNLELKYRNKGEKTT
jgi:hypothetical protein